MHRKRWRPWPIGRYDSYSISGDEGKDRRAEWRLVFLTHLLGYIPMAETLSHPESSIKFASLWTLADLSKLALRPRTHRLGALRRRVKSGTYWVEPRAISRIITDFYES